jgi:8-oxo-dGTP pyrophosphatase MutT (NUDIX family)
VDKLKIMEKILTFIVKDKKLLLLLGSDKDPQYHKSFWYVVTGGCENEDKSLEDTVKRETMEETRLTLTKIVDLDWTFEYESLGEHCIEHAFISFTDNDKVILNEESIDYKWCDLNEFISLIERYGDKKELKEKLINFI